MRKKIYNLRAPAKINIGLRVLSKRKDGFHNIETIFYPIKLFDHIKLQISPGKNSRNIDIKTIPSGLIQEDNVCTKAVNTFLNEFVINENYNIKITIRKKIPIGGGLGGGSSDAASVLKALYNYFKSHIKTVNAGSILKKIALSLGSDIPFFLKAKPAYAESRGEKLKVINRLHYDGITLLVNPYINISTPWAFNELHIKNERKKKKINNLIEDLDSYNFMKLLNAYKSTFENDFEKIIFKKYPEIKFIKEHLLIHGATFASLSGSGSTVYGIFKDKPKETLKYFKSKGYFVYLA